MVRKMFHANYILLSASGKQNCSCSPSPLPPRLFFFFFCTLKVFVLMPSVLRFSALLKHFHGSDEIELLGLGFKKYIYIYVYVCVLQSDNVIFLERFI